MFVTNAIPPGRKSEQMVLKNGESGRCSRTKVDMMASCLESKGSTGSERIGGSDGLEGSSRLCWMKFTVIF